MLDLPHPHYLSDPSLPLSSLASSQPQAFVLTVLYARNTLQPFHPDDTLHIPTLPPTSSSE